MRRALTHSSADAVRSNERLEFLGDRVLGLIVAEELHARYPQESEGELTRKLHALVRWEACARAAEDAGLWNALTVSLSVDDRQGRSRGTILGSACEAIIAALYLDGGIEVARRFVECYWREQFENLARDLRDPKTKLQEWSQAQEGRPSPSYAIVKREGPDHAPRFLVQVFVAGQESMTGEGGSKREAEQDAAKNMLMKVIL